MTKQETDSFIADMREIQKACDEAAPIFTELAKSIGRAIQAFDVAAKAFQEEIIDSIEKNTDGKRDRLRRCLDIH